MLIYLRKLTKNDTRKQIESTKEAYVNFFDGDENEEEGITFVVTSNGSERSFRLSKAAGQANSYRFSSLNGEESFSTFINSTNNIEFQEQDILKISKTSRRYLLELIQTTDSNYEAIASLIQSKSNPTILFDNSSIQYMDFSRQKIYFGAPGTGKSKKISTEMDKLLNSYETNYERVTFHPDYSYAQFVGIYKPVPDDNDRNKITYKYVPGPFIRTLVKAKNNPEEPFLLIIEEINRANIAAVFGDVFQLLDRENYISEYPISPSEDLKKYLSETLEESQELTELRIPQNMFIWATMNSADQGVFPMDTAFKRRWEFEYMGINDNEEVICSHTYTLGSSQNERQVNWNELRKAINNFLLEKNVNEDKLLGPFFISPSVLQEEEKFKDTFKNKVLMYLFDDAAKNKGKDLFAGCDQYKLFSAILSEFDSKGVLIFNESISDQFSEPNTSEETTGNSDVVNSNEEEE